MKRTPLRLPPPTNGDAEEKGERENHNINTTAAASEPTSNDCDVIFDNGAATVTHAAKIEDASIDPSRSISDSGTSRKLQRISNPTTQGLPLPRISSLPRPLTRSTLSSLLRAHLSTSLAPGDALHACGNSVTKLLPTLPHAVLRVAHAKIHAFPYKDVPACWLRAWAEGCLWRCAELLGKDEGDEKSKVGTWLDEVVRVLDMGLILAGGVGREKVFEWAFAALEEMLGTEVDDGAGQQLQAESGEQSQESRARKKQKLDHRNDTAPGTTSWTCPASFPASTISPPPLRNPIRRVDAQAFGLDAFQAHLDEAKRSDHRHHENETETDADYAPDLPGPLIITNALTHWPAIADPHRRWSDPRYLLRRTLGGRRLVPVEVGRSYTDEGWGQRIVSVSEFLRRFMFGTPASADEGSDRGGRSPGARQGDGYEAIEAKSHEPSSPPPPPPPPTGYLAQHDLLSQIPALRADMGIPDYCYTIPPPPASSPRPPKPTPPPPPPPDFPLINAWFGPASTISPLHTDPYHNILCQAVGAKYVRLYPPRLSPAMHPRGVGADGVDMGNTSEVDVGAAIALERAEQSDEPASSSKFSPDDDDDQLLEKRRAFEARFPGFLGARCVDAVLAAGEALYVPKGWWHYVTSLGPSFSVSFWWDRRDEDGCGEEEEEEG